MNRIRELRGEKGWSQAELGQRAGMSQSVIARLEKEDRPLKIDQMRAISAALAVDIADLIAPRSSEKRTGQGFTPARVGAEIEPIEAALRPIWIKGEVQAGAWFEAAEWPEDQWEPTIGVDRAHFPYRDMFAVRVRGRSMDQVFPPGSVLICVGAGFDREVPRHGDYVVVHRRGKGGDLWESTVKYLEVDGDGRSRLWARSTLPEFADPIEPTSEGDDDVQIIGIVLHSLVQHRR